jgi:hypothetical protein
MRKLLALAALATMIIATPALAQSAAHARPTDDQSPLFAAWHLDRTSAELFVPLVRVR